MVSSAMVIFTEILLVFECLFFAVEKNVEMLAITMFIWGVNRRKHPRIVFIADSTGLEGTLLWIFRI